MMNDKKFSGISGIIGFAANGLSILASIYVFIVGIVAIEFPYWCWRSYSYSYYSYRSSGTYEWGADGDVLGAIMIIAAVLVFLINAASLVFKILVISKTKKPVQSPVQGTNIAQQATVGAANDDYNDKFQKREKLHELLSSGVITQEEFDRKKSSILSDKT